MSTDVMVSRVVRSRPELPVMGSSSVGGGHYVIPAIVVLTEIDGETRKGLRLAVDGTAPSA